MSLTSQATSRPPLLDRIRAVFADRRVRELLWYCAPALLLGLVLRTMLTVQMPYGYMQFDTVDFLVTARHLITHGGLNLHNKRTFLVPALYTIPFLLRLPAVIVIPIAQHLLGLCVIVFAGALVRLWVRAWKWVIVPVTLILAANPILLWFEHVLMSECVYLFCAMGLALAGTVFALRKDARSFRWLLAALFFTAGARPEGRLFLAFGFLLVLFVQWGEGKLLYRRLAWLAGLSLVVLPITRTGQAGQLLYASVLPFAPDESRVAPDFARVLRPLRDEARAASVGKVNTELTSLEKKLTDLADAYLKEKGIRRMGPNDLCKKLAVEACLHQPLALPGLAAKKFLTSNKNATSIGYDEPILHKKLVIGYSRRPWLIDLSKGLTGQALTDAAQIDAFVTAHYHPMAWYAFLDQTWRKFTLMWRPDSGLRKDPPIPPLPYFFMFALGGAALALVQPDRLRRFHLAWIIVLAGLWFAVELTGVVNPRYRFVFEPFCVIYGVFGIATLGSLCAAGLRRLTGRRGALAKEISAS